MIDIQGTRNQELMEQVTKLVDISLENIDEILMKHSANYVWYSTLLVRTSTKRSQIKFELDVLKAELSKRVRAEAAANNIKLTEAMVENEILTNPQYQAKYEEFLTVKEEEEMLNALVKGMEQRKDLLVSLISLRKEELKSRISM